MVLAVGIVVDDAIVVVENVERNIARGLSARDATYTADARSERVPLLLSPSRSSPRVRSARIHERSDGPVLQTVCDDDCYLDRHLRIQLADPFTSAVGSPAAWS